VFPRNIEKEKMMKNETTSNQCAGKIVFDSASVEDVLACPQNIALGIIRQASTAIYVPKDKTDPFGYQKGAKANLAKAK
jgi:hypothetical protein